ncbi:asparagine synthase-related protein [Alkalibacterium sp. f15]|uniref:asparagine synthase-related protein n=1 Tax=Alkalibacterium sp. f15 TaxID=3414029 RepID=UPI003BF89C28
MVTRLLPGHLLEYSRNGIQTTRIWFIKNDPINSEESFKFKFKDTFYTVINDYLKYLEENKVGFEVSAGLDSSTILSIARDLNPHEIFYSISSIITPEIDSHTKLGNVDKISDLNNSLNLLPIQHDTSEFWAFKNIEKSLNCEEPNPLLVNFDMYQTIHQKVNTYGITHLFSGEGADEILSSSRNYLFDFFSNMRFSKGLEILNRESVFLKQPMWKLLAAYVVPTFLPKMLKYEYLNKMNTQTWYNLSNNISFIESPPWIIKDNCKIHPSVIEKHRCAVLEPSIKEKGKQFDHEFMSLVSNLNWLDTNVAKPNSVYRLYPFKDKRLIELAFNVEFELKMDLGLNKRGLRETFNNIIPRNILEKPDQSQFEFITRNGINKEWLKVENLIKNSVAADYGWIDKEKLMEAALNYKFGKKENVNALVRTLGLEIWLQNL